MTQAQAVSESTLRITRVFAAPRDVVFRAWTEPGQLKNWWGVQANYTTPIAEIDLRVGGKYRLGMQAPDSEHPFVVAGTYREVSAPENLVYTWTWEQHDNESNPDFQPAETVLTVEFRDLGGKTEVVLTHEKFPDENMRDEHSQGWTGCLDQLARHIEQAGS